MSPREWTASRAKAAAFIASTGKTQGIRFRINPPTSANSSASTNDKDSSLLAATCIDAPGTRAGSSFATMSKAWRCAPSPVFSVSTSVPVACAGGAPLAPEPVAASPFFRGIRMPSAVTTAFCFSMLATPAQSAGKK